jgi:hypothetical protein
MSKTSIEWTQDELHRAIREYDNSITYINQAKVFGYQFPLSTFELLSQMHQKKTDKIGVCFQTHFLNELIKDFLENKRPIEVTFIKLHKWFRELILTQKEVIDWENVMLASGENLIEVLRTHHEIMPNRVYWQMVSDCYTRSNLAHSHMDIILDYLSDKRPDKEYLMDDEEREFFISLPDEVTIYRGCTKKEIESGKFRISWTLDKKVAEFFAYTYKNSVHEDRGKEKDISKFDVVEKTVRKKDLLCYFGGRNEAEVLYI